MADGLRTGRDGNPCVSSLPGLSPNIVNSARFDGNALWRNDLSTESRPSIAGLPYPVNSEQMPGLESGNAI